MPYYTAEHEQAQHKFNVFAVEETFDGDEEKTLVAELTFAQHGKQANVQYIIKNPDTRLQEYIAKFIIAVLPPIHTFIV